VWSVPRDRTNPTLTHCDEPIFHPSVPPSVKGGDIKESSGLYGRFCVLLKTVYDLGLKHLGMVSSITKEA